MPQPNLRIFFDGLEEAKPGMPCYDPAQPWFVHLTVVNANSDSKWGTDVRALDPNKPTSKAGPFAVSFEVFAGATAASGGQHLQTYTVDGLGAYPGDDGCAKGFSVQLPKNIAVADFGKLYGFRLKADMYHAVTESNEDDNIFVWESAQAPMMAPQWSDGESSPFSNLKFIDFKAIPNSLREIDVLVKNQGSKTSLQLELRLTIMGPPTPQSPTGSAIESVSVNSTAIPSGTSKWVRFKATTSFIQPRAGLTGRDAKRLQGAGSRTFRQVQAGTSRLLGNRSIPRYLVVEKDFDFVPLKPFFIALMHASNTEKVAFGESPAPRQPVGGKGHIAIPQK